MIYCHRGWVRVVYEDQGEPFVVHPGDCVLQPPEIRHRVLECSSNLEVIEIGCPAIHETWADHDMTLPTQRIDSGRLFSDQQFVRHVAEQACWSPWIAEGFEYRDTGIGEATNGIGSVEVIRRADGDSQSPQQVHHHRLSFAFMLRGAARLQCEANETTVLSAGDSFVIPPGHAHQLEDCSKDFELLRVSIN